MKKILIVGLPFFPKKYKYLTDAYKKLGVDVKVLINSKYLPDCDESKSGLLMACGSNNFKRISYFMFALFKFKPRNLDCYSYSLISIIYVIIGRIFNVNVRFWLIGSELMADTKDVNSNELRIRAYVKVKCSLTWWCLQLSDCIFAKEMHHIDRIKSRFPNLLNKTTLIHNCVPVGSFDERERLKAKKDFIYANAVIESRNVVPLITAFREFKDTGAEFAAAIYGFSSISNEVYAPRALPYSKKALSYLKKSKLDGFVSAHGFVNNIKEIMIDYRFFILPGDVILANYALLEAMSKGLIPIVYPGNGYEKVVEDGINGFVAWDDDLLGALQRAQSLTSSEYLCMSKSAFQTIKSRFSIDIWLEKLQVKLY